MDAWIAHAEVARYDRQKLLARAAPVLREHPAIAPVLLYRTLGPTLPGGAASAAILWPGCHRAAKLMTIPVQRALGTELTEPALGEELFDRILASPSGIAFSVHEYHEVWNLMRSDRIQLAVPELLAWLGRLDPAFERLPRSPPFTGRSHDPGRLEYGCSRLHRQRVTWGQAGMAGWNGQRAVPAAAAGPPAGRGDL